MAMLPCYVQKLVQGCAARVFYFEILECVRKLALVCMPVFFDPAGSPAQLIFGLFVCFITFGAYSALEPYKKLSDGKVALLSQAFIFFSLLASITLSFSPAEFGSSVNAMDMLLTIMLFVPAVGGVVLEMPTCICLRQPALFPESAAQVGPKLHTEVQMEAADLSEVNSMGKLMDLPEAWGGVAGGL